MTRWKNRKVRRSGKAHYTLLREELSRRGQRLLKRDFKLVDGRTIPKARRPPPTSGQSAPPAEIEPARLTVPELQVRSALRAATAVAGLAEKCDLTSLQVRNALRRLVRGGFVVRVGRGVYAPGKPLRRRKESK